MSAAMTARESSSTRLALDRLDDDSSAMCVFDAETTTCIAVNEATLQLFEYAREAFLGLTYAELVHPGDDDLHAYSSNAGCHSPIYCGTRRHLKKSGDEFLADVVAQDVLFTGKSALLLLIIDRSEAARTQALLRQREALFSALVEHSPDVIARIDRELRHVYVNPAVAAVTGVAADDLIGKTDRQLGVPLELCMRWAAGARRVFATGRQHDIQIAYATADGTRHYESRMVPEIGPDGQVESVLAIARDVTERRQTELNLRASESLLRRTNLEFEALADALPQLITCYDRNLRHIYANAAVERATGVSATALMHRTHAEAGTEPELAKLWDDCIQKVFDTAQPENLEYVYPTPAGPRCYEAYHVPLSEQGGVVNSVLRVAYDVTERKLAEEDRVASITRQRDAFVREVHHRVKNNLQGVVGLLRQLGNRDPTLSAVLEKAISQLLAMAVVHGVTGRELHDGVVLGEMVTEIVRSVERTTGTTILMQSNGGEADYPRLSANEAVPVALVLNELVLNAVKHCRAAPETAPVAVMLEGDAARAQITVVNEGLLPQNFDYARGLGLGTGLELVKALLPPQDAALSFSRDNGRVKAVLELRAALLVATTDTLENTRHDWDRRKRSYSDRRR